MDIHNKEFADVYKRQDIEDAHGWDQRPAHSFSATLKQRDDKNQNYHQPNQQIGQNNGNPRETGRPDQIFFLAEADLQQGQNDSYQRAERDLSLIHI